MAKERVQKILARAGIASRRKAEELIIEGAVTINGKVATLGEQAEWGVDAIKVRGKLLHSTEAPIYLSFYKPKGVISMFGDPEGRPSLKDYLGGVKQRLFPVGRLDFNSEGLLLLTNDGDFAEKIQKRDDIIRVYQVKIKGHPDAEMLKRLERPAKIGFKMVKPESVKLTQSYAKKALIEVILVGAGAIDLKQFFEFKGFLVERITRVAFGHVRLSGMKIGEFKFLADTQAKALLDQPELGMKRQLLAEEKRHLPEVPETRAHFGDEEEPRTNKPGKIVVKSPKPKRDFVKHGDPEKRRSFGDRPSFGKTKTYGKRASFGDRPSFGGKSKSEDRPSFGKRPSSGKHASPAARGSQFQGAGRSKRETGKIVIRKRSR